MRNEDKHKYCLSVALSIYYRQTNNELILIYLGLPLKMSNSQNDRIMAIIGLSLSFIELIFKHSVLK